jgi:membrane-bound lytic murein transglycosylase D
MLRPYRLSVLAVAFAGGLCVGCGGHTPPAEPAAVAVVPLPVRPVASSVTPKTEVPLPPPDPALSLVSRAHHEFQTGQQELAVGHLVAAREAFDRAVDMLLTTPDGARSNPDVSAELDRLLDRISALEAQALRDGDGFTEARSAPAVIDALLGATADPPPPAATTQEMVQADLAQTPHDLPIPLNTKVMSYVELWRGTLHDVMQDSLDRSVRYIPMIEDALKAEGLPLDLAYLPIVESGFNPTALSRAAAKGLWQFEADTGHDNGLDLNWFRDDRSDPEKATVAAAKYLKWLADQYSGDWFMTLAAYNCGIGRVDAAEKRAKLTDYWTLSDTSRFLPRDTREYVPMVLASILIARNPTHYGFDVPAVPLLAYERVTVPDAIDLGVIAEWAGVPVEQIRDLNPELRRATTPLGKHDLKVPVGTAPMIEGRLATADPSVFARSQFQWHTVKKGESLSSIARQAGVRTANLASANGVTTAAKVQVGQQLMIPRAPAATPAAATRKAAPTSTTSSAAPAAAPPTSTSAATGATTYRVKPGDTLYSIARQFETTVETLKHLNGLSTDVIVIGDRLTVRR